jgi:hypothetical protein
MKCEICKKEVGPRKNSVVCSDKCKDIRKLIFELEDKYFPRHGCENCWGDLHQGCTEQCKKEFRECQEFGTDLWKLVRKITDVIK